MISQEELAQLRQDISEFSIDVLREGQGYGLNLLGE